MNPPPHSCRWLGRMDWVLGIFAVIAGWAVLRVIGAERARRVHDLTVNTYLQSKAQALAAAPPEKTVPTTGISHPPVRSKAGR